MVRQNLHEHVPSLLHGPRARSYRRTSGHRQTSAVQDLSAVFYNRHVPIFSDVSGALCCDILRSSAQRLLRFSRLRLHPPRLRANRVALPSSVGGLQGTRRRGPISSRFEQERNNQRMREASLVRERARAQDTVVVCVDRDDFVHFQHGYPVHQYFSNVQGHASTANPLIPIRKSCGDIRIFFYRIRRLKKTLIPLNISNSMFAYRHINLNILNSFFLLRRRNFSALDFCR